MCRQETPFFSLHKQIDQAFDPMKNRRLRIMSARNALLVCAVFLAGCQTTNFFQAESMPSSLRLIAQSNPQEVDLSRLASATGGSQTIGAGDVLDVAISVGLSADDQTIIPVRVGDDGRAILPHIGAVNVAGIQPSAAGALIRGEAVSRGLYPNPIVTVSFKERKMNRVRVLGAVKEPGTYELSPEASDVVSAIAAAQGLAENAGENVEVRNPDFSNAGVGRGRQSPYSSVSQTSSSGGEGTGGNSYSINLISASKTVGNEYTVADGGVVMVEKRDPAPIQVIGLVRDPGSYDFPIGKPLTVLGALALADGVSNQLADKVYVIRPLANGGDPAVVNVSIRKAKRSGKSNIVLGPGDIVSVQETPGTVFMEALQLIRFGVSGSAPLF
jgi:polysaccharide export outer membrane protein